MTRHRFTLRGAIAGALFAVLALFALESAAATYSALVIEADTDRVLYQKNATALRHPASLTKMMTLYMVFEALDNGTLSLRKSLRASRYAASRPASKLGLRAGETITVEQAILALVTHSANDVATVLAEHLGGSESEFARRMTAKARQLGMHDTVFKNASGLPNSAQVTTAWDMARLAQSLQRRFSHRYHYFSTTNFRFRNRNYHNHNHLIKNYPGTDGIKTGYINASGYNLVASVRRDGRRLIGVVFGGNTSRSRDAHMRELLNNGFAQLNVGESPFRSAQVVPMGERRVRVAQAGRPSTIDSVPARRPSTASKRGSTWKVRVGAFSRYENAQKRLSQVRKIAPLPLRRARQGIATQSRGGSRLYIAYYQDLTRDDANAACRALKKRNLECMAVY